MPSSSRSRLDVACFLSPYIIALSLVAFDLYARSATLFSALQSVYRTFNKIFCPRTLLCQEQSVALLNGHAVPRVLVVWGESGGVCALADFAIDDLLERVDTLSWVRRIGNEHKMHAGRKVSMVAISAR